MVLHALNYIEKVKSQSNIIRQKKSLFFFLIFIRYCDHLRRKKKDVKKCISPFWRITLSLFGTLWKIWIIVHCVPSFSLHWTQFEWGKKCDANKNGILSKMKNPNQMRWLLIQSLGIKSFICYWTLANKLKNQPHQMSIDILLVCRFACLVWKKFFFVRIWFAVCGRKCICVYVCMSYTVYCYGWSRCLWHFLLSFLFLFTHRVFLFFLSVYIYL